MKLRELLGQNLSQMKERLIQFLEKPPRYHREWPSLYTQAVSGRGKAAPRPPMKSCRRR